jgi:hypothetical protein
VHDDGRAIGLGLQRGLLPRVPEAHDRLHPYVVEHACRAVQALRGLHGDARHLAVGVGHETIVAIHARRRQLAEVGEPHVAARRPRDGDEPGQAGERGRLLARGDDPEQPGAHALPPQWITTS